MNHCARSFNPYVSLRHPTTAPTSITTTIIKVQRLVLLAGWLGKGESSGRNVVKFESENNPPFRRFPSTFYLKHNTGTYLSWKIEGKTLGK